MKKASVLVFAIVFLLGMSVSTAMAFPTDDATLWWSVYDSPPDMNDPVPNSGPTTSVNMAEGDVLHAYLFLSGVAEPGISFFRADMFWNDNDTFFSLPGVEISDSYWNGMFETEYTEPLLGGQNSVEMSAGLNSGHDIPLYYLTLTATSNIEPFGNYEFPWANAEIKLGSTVLPLDSTTYGGLTINPVPIPGAVLLLGSGLLGLVGIGRRCKRRAA